MNAQQGKAKKGGGLNRHAIYAIILSLSFCVLSGAMLLFLPFSSPFLGYLITGSVWALSILLLCQVPSILREGRLAQGPFLPLDERGNPQSGNPAVRQFALLAGQQLQGTAYRVLTSEDAARIEWNTGDIRYATILSLNRAQRVYTSIFANVGGSTFIRRDGFETFDATLGVLHASSWHEMSAGKVAVKRYEKVIALTPEGVRVPIDHWLDSSVITRAAKRALAQMGGRERLSTVTRIGIAAGLICGLGGVLGGVVATLLHG